VEEIMKYFVFNRESNDFSDILNDPSLKKHIKWKISFFEHLIISFGEDNKSIEAIVVLKYGDDLTSMSHIAKDRTPIIDKDYTPKYADGWSKQLLDCS
jgi:hypothetical protein